MVTRLRGLSHRSSIHSVIIKGNSAWMPTAIPAASPSVTNNPHTSPMSQRIRMTAILLKLRWYRRFNGARA